MSRRWANIKKSERLVCHQVDGIRFQETRQQTQRGRVELTLAFGNHIGQDITVGPVKGVGIKINQGCETKRSSMNAS